MKTKDLIVVGGGINGAGIAADAAGRGLSVLLLEKFDLAYATSSASSKLIHGGLRYLEYYEFRLVREALAEREVLLRMAPHIIFPIKFFLPYLPNFRSAWLIRLGLFIYDRLSRRNNLPSSSSLRCDPKLGFISKIYRGFEYFDCWVDDSRLVVLNALEVLKHGGEVLTGVEVIKARRMSGIWEVKVKDNNTGKINYYYSKGLVNATGPWVKQCFNDVLNLESPHNVRLIKGSHIVVPILSNQKQAYILQNDDSRIVFVIPWLNKFSIIGTTDVEYKGDPINVTINDDEINYLLKVCNKYFCKTLRRTDIVWSYSGVRPLWGNKTSSPQSVTRDYLIDIQDDNGTAPLLSIFGGKLTTYRKLAEFSLNKLSKYYINMKPSWTRNCILSGGDIGISIEDYSNKLRIMYPFLTKDISYHYSSTYGTSSNDILKGVNNLDDLGEHFGNVLYQVELDYLIKYEWAKKLDDVIWRRTKLGIFLNEKEKILISKYLSKSLNTK
ncbi:glycerol-3-phosphate dehydrogenase [Candidatus Purcelliella pentastirinorum]|uniref:Glycerol-3-phosphate dehydrogenase n=1 Tax=Candidatus Purcelliella pentastirinorum TaxID=472834 RepID=A0AAX3N8Z5_9ENTR|nr:glycerol-3-phosphate dehydrogenase [Candidatus Purcelliella pentastirinorum]WDI78479.1 glycerol-3-phosphate dehydrogenase [Candidatus Purcelliella pentastirinorum]WDR80492.1 glycerol-3-phosphate dehydrogenase [Candidatus Purcelliella pentastirinorum]